MRKIIALLPMIFLISCAHGPRCGNLDGAKVVLIGSSSCQVRIKQVMVGSDLKIPPSLKGSGLALFQLEWVEGGLNNGRIELGHFVLVPSTQSGVRP